jgi:hypothetical protein
LLDILETAKYITLFSETIPFIFTLLFFKRVKSRDKRLFFIYSLLTTVLVLLSLYFRVIKDNRPDYLLVGRLHLLVEFSLLSYIFSLFINNGFVKKIAAFALIPFIIFCIVDYVQTNEPSIAYTPLLIECVFFVSLIVYFFFEKMQQDGNEPLFNTFVFWFAVAFLLNYSGNFLLFLYSETSKKDPDFKINYAIIYSTVTIIKNILLCIAVTMRQSNNIAKPSNGNDFLKNMNPAIFNPTKIETY